MSKAQALTNAINGVFSVYKPKGMTSRKATDFVQFALCNELWQHKDVPLKRRDRIKIGHGGTLDPLAEGVLGNSFLSPPKNKSSNL
jgi:tRNA pseudouridine55 synthase